MAKTELVKAIYKKGTLELLDSVRLPEGAEVWVSFRVAQPHSEEGAASASSAMQQESPYPTRPQPPETLARLVGVVDVGGDALADSEASYDADWN